jgi:hypothetical protein
LNISGTTIINNNLGIGITPSYKLHINNGALYIGDQTATAIVNDNGYRLIFDNSLSVQGTNLCNKILLHNNTFSPGYLAGIGTEPGGSVYSTWIGASHKFYNGTTNSHNRRHNKF